MDNNELNQLVDAWILAQQSEKNSEARKQNLWAVDKVIDFAYNQHSELWQFIVAAYPRIPEGSHVGDDIAAGPLENLISKFGNIYIDQIEDLAKKDEKFRKLLYGVWQNKTPNEIWKRIESARDN